MLEIKNSLIQKIVSSQIEQNFISSSILEFDLREQNKLYKFRRMKIDRQKITHLIFKCFFFQISNSLYYIGMEEKTQMIEAAKRCNRLKILEVDAVSKILAKAIFHKTVNEISKSCSNLNQIVCLIDEKSLQNNRTYESGKRLFQKCKKIDTITLKRYEYKDQNSKSAKITYKRGFM